jgi:hypothetical protein
MGVFKKAGPAAFFNTPMWRKMRQIFMVEGASLNFSVKKMLLWKYLLSKLFSEESGFFDLGFI